MVILIHLSLAKFQQLGLELVGFNDSTSNKSPTLLSNLWIKSRDKNLASANVNGIHWGMNLIN
jgi:hypothetical protein